jgi:hypothetical protein
MFQKIIAWFTNRFSKKLPVGSPLAHPSETPLGIPDEPETDIQRKAKEKRERRRKRNLSHINHRSNDDRKTTGATGSMRRNRE